MGVGASLHAGGYRRNGILPETPILSVWPREYMPALGPRVALLCEGTAFKKVSKISAEKLKSSNHAGIKAIVEALGGLWGQTVLAQNYEHFERAIYTTVQKGDETHDSYIARHDVHFEELLDQNISFGELWAYVLLRQSQLSPDDKKRIVIEHGGDLSYSKVRSSMRLLGSRFFGEMQGSRSGQRVDQDGELDQEFIDGLLASEDQTHRVSGLPLSPACRIWDTLLSSDPSHRKPCTSNGLSWQAVRPSRKTILCPSLSLWRSVQQNPYCLSR